MAGQPGFLDGDDRLKARSTAADPLERLGQVIDFEVFGVDLEAALSRSDRAKGGRQPCDAVQGPGTVDLVHVSDDLLHSWVATRSSVIQRAGARASTTISPMDNGKGRYFVYHYM